MDYVREVCILILKNCLAPSIGDIEPIHIDIMGLNIRVKCELDRSRWRTKINSISMYTPSKSMPPLRYIFGTNDWTCEIDALDERPPKIITGDFEKFENDMCLIKVALA